MATSIAPATARASVRPRPLAVVRRLAFITLVGILVALVLFYGRIAILWSSELRRTTPVYDPPVLAGQYLSNGCSTGVYAKRADGTIVLTTTGHCLLEGQSVNAPDGRLVGIASAPTNWASCDEPGMNRCTGSDMAYVAVAPSMIPWGRLDQIDMGAGGYRTVAPGTRPLACAEVKDGDPVEFDGRSIFRTGHTYAHDAYDFLPDRTYFPCIVLTDVSAGGGDSGGLVLVDGQPAGVASRVFGADQLMGFTPLADGLAELGITMCDMPNCGLTPPPAK